MSRGFVVRALLIWSQGGHAKTTSKWPTGYAARKSHSKTSATMVGLNLVSMSRDTTSYPSSANTRLTLPVPETGPEISGARPSEFPWGLCVPSPLAPGPEPQAQSLQHPADQAPSTVEGTRRCTPACHPDAGAHHHQSAVPRCPTGYPHTFYHFAGTIWCPSPHIGAWLPCAPAILPILPIMQAPRKLLCTARPAAWQLLAARDPMVD
jgi:hypothetical protein